MYDANDRVTSQIDPLSHSTVTGYDNSGDRTSLTDRDTNVTTYTYDNAARLATVVQKPDPVNQPTLVYTTSLTRDDNGNTTKVTQANNVVTDYTFDELNQLKSVISHPRELDLTYHQLRPQRQRPADEEDDRRRRRDYLRLRHHGPPDLGRGHRLDDDHLRVR